MVATKDYSGFCGSQYCTLNTIISSFLLALADTETQSELTKMPAKALKGRQLSSVLENDQIYLNWHDPVHYILN